MSSASGLPSSKLRPQRNSSGYSRIWEAVQINHGRIEPRKRNFGRYVRHDGFSLRAHLCTLPEAAVPPGLFTQPLHKLSAGRLLPLDPAARSRPVNYMMREESPGITAARETVCAALQQRSPRQPGQRESTGVERVKPVTAEMANVLEHPSDKRTCFGEDTLGRTWFLGGPMIGRHI